MKIKEIKELSTEELSKRKTDLRKESFNLRLQQVSGNIEKPSRLRDIRREVARLETVASQRRNQQAAKA